MLPSPHTPKSKRKNLCRKTELSLAGAASSIIFVVTKLCLLQLSLVRAATSIIFVTTKVLSQCLSQQNMSFFKTKICLSWQKFCCNKTMFVTTNKTFVMTNICHNKHNYVRTKHVFCRNKIMLQQKLCLWQFPPMILNRYSLFEQPSRCTMTFLQLLGSQKEGWCLQWPVNVHEKKVQMLVMIQYMARKKMGIDVCSVL